jgi:hypothetical protein
MKIKRKDKKSELIVAYNKLKLEIDKQIDSETLKKYEILSKAYKLGKQIYGNMFSVAKLALDFEVPYTTTKRILALRKANSITWKKIKSGKISSFKASMVLMKKDTAFQDEMIDIVIKDKLSTYQIRSLNVKNKQDVDKQRLKVAVEKGFARANTAYSSFNNTLERIDYYLLMDINHLPKNKIPLIEEKLKELNKKINEYLLKIK